MTNFNICFRGTLPHFVEAYRRH
jgi:hypothetical protein